MNLTLNTKTMKKQLIILAIALVLTPLTTMAQSIFDKYSDNSDVTYVSMKPKMFQMLAKLDVSSEDAETGEFLDMVNSITSFKTIATGNAKIASDIASYVSSKSNSLEELMEMKEDGTNVKFYVKDGSSADHVEELLIYVNGLDSKDAKDAETVIISLTGNIDLNQVSKLTKKMNLPGGNTSK